MHCRPLRSGTTLVIIALTAAFRRTPMPVCQMGKPFQWKACVIVVGGIRRGCLKICFWVEDKTDDQKTSSSPCGLSMYSRRYRTRCSDGRSKQLLSQTKLVQNFYRKIFNHQPTRTSNFPAWFPSKPWHRPLRTALSEDATLGLTSKSSIKDYQQSFTTLIYANQYN